MFKRIALISISLGTLTALAVSSFSHKNPSQHVVAQATTEQLPVAKHKNIIFDLNGVLFGIKKGRAASYLGIGNMLSYLMAGHKSADLEEQMFDVLYQFDKDAGITSADSVVPLHNNKPLPHVMRQWMRGALTSEDILAKLMPFIEKLDAQGYFAKPVEKTVITKLATVFFDPEVRTKLYAPIKKCVKLLKKCKAQGHKVYLLSNIDVALIDLLKVKYPQVFEQFDGMVLSAEVGLIKPDTNIFSYALRKFNLRAEDTVFLDDQRENKVSAEQEGIAAIQYDQNKHKIAQNELQELGVLTSSKHRETAVKMA